MGSGYNLSSSMGSAEPSGMFRRATLTNRAVSCSDLLLEFSEKNKKRKESPMVSTVIMSFFGVAGWGLCSKGYKNCSEFTHSLSLSLSVMQKFSLLAPLTSEPCTPNSSRRSSIDDGHSIIFSSNSSLSSLDSAGGFKGPNSPIEAGEEGDRDGSITPTAASDGSERLHPHPLASSTPARAEDDDESAEYDDDSKNDTLKKSNRYTCRVDDSHDNHSQSEEECDGDTNERGFEQSTESNCWSENVTSQSIATKSRKNGWRLSLFKRKKK